MDLRIERTYRSLTQAFTELLESGPYDDITVAALCERAMIRRTTFYKHFADKDEFFCFFLKSVRDEFEQRIGAFEASSFEARSTLMLGETLAFLREHEKLAGNAINSPNALMLFDALSSVIYNDSLPLLKAQGVSDPEIRAAFVSGGILQMVRQWFEQGCPKDAEPRMLAALESMLDGR